MQNHTVLTFTPVDHPDAHVQRVGFDLADPYLEQCWGPVIGPSATLLLCRMSTQWSDRVPATITQGELARSLGLGAGTLANSRLVHAVDRTVRFGFASGTSKGVRSTCSSKHLGWFSAGCSGSLGGPDKRTSGSSTLLDAHRSHFSVLDDTVRKVAAMTARLDRLQRAPQHPSRGPNRPHLDRRTMSRHRRPDHPASHRPTHDLVLPEDQIRRAHACRFPFGKLAGGRVRSVS